MQVQINADVLLPWPGLCVHTKADWLSSCWMQITSGRALCFLQDIVSRSGLHASFMHACMQHIGHVGARAAETAHARGGCVSRQIIHISGIRPFIKNVFSRLGLVHNPSEI